MGQVSRCDNALQVARQVNGTWVDYFFGAAQPSGDRLRHSLLDAEARVGLHFHRVDLPSLQKMSRPAVEIPPHLWFELQHRIQC